MAGYSQRSLVDKLGITSSMKAVILNQPKDYHATLGDLPKDLNLSSRLSKNLNFIQCFVTTQKDLDTRFPKMATSIVPNGMIWISWPKQSSKLKTDLNENTIREKGLKLGLVDIKVCAVDETWSGLKFVIRKENRVH